MKLKSEITTLDDLRLAQELASMEAFAGGESVKNALARLPNIMDGAKALYGKVFNYKPATLFKPRGMMDSFRAVERYPYVDLRDVQVTVPEGLRVDLLSYARALHQAGLVAVAIENDVMRPFERWLAQMVGNPQTLASLSNNLKIPGMRDLSFSAVEKTIQNMFVTQGQRTNTVPYMQAFHRNQDVRLLSDELDQLERLFGKDSQQRILTIGKRVSELLEEIIEIVKTSQGDSRPSPAVIRSLAETSFHVARLMEQYGLFRYRLTELSHAADSTNTTLKAWAKK